MKYFKIVFLAFLSFYFLFVFTPNTFAVTEGAEKDMLLVFDASGSMTDQFGGVQRIDALKTAVNDLMNTLDTSVMVGLRPFANIRKSIESEACKVTSLAQSFTSERSIIKTQTSLLQAVGAYTPLAYTLNISGGDFKIGNDNVLVLLTDGKDTCGGDPVKAAGDLFNSNKKIKVYVIGMGVDSDTKKQLSLIASSGGGIYYDASDSNSLAASFKAIQSLEKPISRTEKIGVIEGYAVVGGNDFVNAELILANNQYRLKDSLAPGQFAYFKISPCIYSPKGSKVAISFKIFGDRLGVSYNSVNNSFEESNLHNYRMEFFSGDTFSFGSPIEIRDANMLKQIFTTDIITGGVCGDPGKYIIKVGSKDFPISKYDTFKIEMVGSTTPTSAPSVSSNIKQVQDSQVQDQVTTTITPNKVESSSNPTNILVYILVGFGILLVLAVIAIVLLLKKGTAPSSISSSGPIIPPSINSI